MRTFSIAVTPRAPSSASARLQNGHTAVLYINTWATIELLLLHLAQARSLTQVQ
jgi:hypothetical protein